jgi:acyl carrier protein
MLGIEDESIDEAHRFDELGLDSLDLVLVVLRLEEFYRGAGEFPVAELAQASRVADLVCLVQAWLRREDVPNTLRALGSLPLTADDRRV